MTDSDKHSSLLRYEINYGCKTFYDINPTLKILSRKKPSGLFFENNIIKSFMIQTLHRKYCLGTDLLAYFLEII